MTRFWSLLPRLLVLWLWPILSVFVSSPTFAYDFHQWKTDVYDGTIKFVSGYEVDAVLTTTQSAKQSVGARTFFVNFAKFLAADSGGAFGYYTRQAQTLDVSTAENGAVFWSGQGNQALAEQFAAANGKTTLEVTPGGSWMQAQDLFNPATSPLSGQQASQVWDTLSQRFTAGASGNAVGFVNGARAASTFNRIAFPGLLNNPNINNVITGGH